MTRDGRSSRGLSRSMFVEHNSQETKNAARLFAALGHEIRLELLAQLSERVPFSISELADGTSMTRQAITKHLHVMAEAGLVQSARDGRHQLWQMNPQEVRRARRYLRRIAHQWDDALARLKSAAEKDQMLP